MPGEFEDLDAYRKAREFRRRVWKLAELLPPMERSVLAPQMRRAALSITNNIAEGHGSWSCRHDLSYLRRSRGSVNELMDDLNARQDQGYFKPEHLDSLREHAREVIRLLNGYTAYLKRQLAKPEAKDNPE
ncbi:MAG TPA: four helix bundle protein [Phycisphaerae bacterium]|nr:four helix bundle protein [Phycisphaerae bacterium]